jgi:hypothetical protein
MAFTSPRRVAPLLVFLPPLSQVRPTRSVRISLMTATVIEIAAVAYFVLTRFHHQPLAFPHG